jgi:hypothetical protein
MKRARDDPVGQGFSPRVTRCDLSGTSQREPITPPDGPGLGPIPFVDYFVGKSLVFHIYIYVSLP